MRCRSQHWGGACFRARWHSSPAGQRWRSGAGPQGCTALGFDPPHLRALIIGHAEIGEIVMRVLILRRVGLIAADAGPLLVGWPGAPELVRLQGLLTRNGYPHHVVDTQGEEGRDRVLPMWSCICRPRWSHSKAMRGDGAAAIAQIHAALAEK